MARCNNPERYFNPATATTAVIVLGTLAALGIGAAVFQARRRPRQVPGPKPEPKTTCPAGQVWSPEEAKCVPIAPRPKAEVGDIVAQGEVGGVGWRVIWSYDPNHPEKSDPMGVKTGSRNIYTIQYIDPSSPVEMDRKWFGWGWGFYEIQDAAEEAKKVASQRPWHG